MNYFILTFFLFQILVFAQIDDTLIEKARKFLYENEVHHRPFYIDTINQEINEKPYELARNYYQFNEEIKTPLKKTKFLRYSIMTMSPTPSYIIASFNDSLVLLIQWNCNEGYACDSLIRFFNNNLKEENLLNEDQLVELAYALIKISSPSWNIYKIISNYSDVSWIGENRSVVHLPDSLKEVIKPIKTKRENNGIELHYYLWDEVKLKKGLLHYHNNNIDVKLITIWDSGRRLGFN